MQSTAQHAYGFCHVLPATTALACCGRFLKPNQGARMVASKSQTKEQAQSHLTAKLTCKHSHFKLRCQHASTAPSMSQVKAHAWLLPTHKPRCKHSYPKSHTKVQAQLSQKPYQGASTAKDQT